MLTFAIGDIHGCLDQLKQAFAWIDGERNGEKCRVILLGDYIDCGPDSAGVIDFILSKMRQYFLWEVLPIEGNHEEMLKEVAHQWAPQYGYETLKSYGLSTVEYRDIPNSHKEFLHNLLPYYEDDHRIYVHAGIHPQPGLTPIVNIDMKEQSPNDYRWIRHGFLLWNDDFNKVVIHGHSPTSYDPRNGDDGNWQEWKPVIVNNRINLDTGCCFGGKLTVMKFHSDKPGYECYMQFEGYDGCH